MQMTNIAHLDIENQKLNSCFSHATFDNFSFFLDFCKIDTSISTSHGCRFQEPSMWKEYHFMKKTIHNLSEI